MNAANTITPVFIIVIKDVRRAYYYQVYSTNADCMLCAPHVEIFHIFFII